MGFQCDLNDGLMREACLTGRYEPQETALLRHLLRPGMRFVDVGANWGYFTLVAAHLVTRTGRVASIEADPRACRALAANIARNHLTQVTLFNLAASDSPGSMWLTAYEGNAGDFGNFGVARTSTLVEDAPRQKIPARALDSVLDEAGFDRVDLLKMDIEGAEALALRGLSRRLADRRIDRIVLEVHPYHLRDLDSSPVEVFKVLRGFGYRGWCIDHSQAAHRRAASGLAEISSMLTPFDEGDDLGDWPHMLWTCHGGPL